MVWIVGIAGVIIVGGLGVIVLRRRKERYRIVPLEEPLVSRYSKSKCVYYRTQVYKVMNDGRRILLYDEERSVNFIVLDANALPVNVEIKPKKVYEKFVRARHLSPDPFAYMCKDRPIVLDDTLGVVIREWVIPVR